MESADSMAQGQLWYVFKTINGIHSATVCQHNGSYQCKKTSGGNHWSGFAGLGAAQKLLSDPGKRFDVIVLELFYGGYHTI